MVSATSKDKYANVMFSSVTESAANTLTFNEIKIGLSLFDKVGLIIHRIEWYAWHVRLLATTDQVEFGLSTSDSWSNSDSSEASIITFHKQTVLDYGTAGNNRVWKEPLLDDFTTLPGGGLLITPKPLYMFTVGANCGAANLVKARLFFTIVNLKPEEYFELLETRQFFG